MKKQTVGRILINLGGVMLLGSAATKLAHVPKVVSQLGAMGFDADKLTFIAILEILSATLFLIPLTRAAGLLLVSSFLGGAIATHLQHNQSIAQPSSVLLLIWLGTWMRHREMLWSLRSDEREVRRPANAPIRTSEI